MNKMTYLTCLNVNFNIISLNTKLTSLYYIASAVKSNALWAYTFSHKLNLGTEITAKTYSRIFIPEWQLLYRRPSASKDQY
jgi:hypothetical protein